MRFLPTAGKFVERKPSLTRPSPVCMDGLSPPDLGNTLAEIRSDGRDGLGMFAIQDIKSGEEILRETPFSEQAAGLAFNRPELQCDPEAQQLRSKLQTFAEKYRHLPHGHPDKYPAEARAVLDQLCDMGQAIAYQQLALPAKAKYAALADCFHKVAQGTPVIITGLTSEVGKQLNLCCGVASSFDGQRWAVLLEKGGISIEPENLKTPGGILRTNGFQVGTGTEVLLEQISRINHSCTPNAVKQRFRFGDGFGDFALSAIRDIHVGEQLFIDYGVPHGSVETRRAWLQMKYNFVCHCKACDTGAAM